MRNPVRLLCLVALVAAAGVLLADVGAPTVVGVGATPGTPKAAEPGTGPAAIGANTPEWVETFRFPPKRS